MPLVSHRDQLALSFFFFFLVVSRSKILRVGQKFVLLSSIFHLLKVQGPVPDPAKADSD